MTVADDLATLRRGALSPKEWKALARVEAEIAQLVRSRDMYVGQRDDARAGERSWQKRAEAAEAEAESWKTTAHNCGARVRELEDEVARLRDGLRGIICLFTPRSDYYHAPAIQKARSLLLAEDGAARQVKADPAVFGESNRLLGAEDGAAFDSEGHYGATANPRACCKNHDRDGAA